MLFKKISPGSSVWIGIANRMEEETGADSPAGQCGGGDAGKETKQLLDVFTSSTNLKMMTD